MKKLLALIFCLLASGAAATSIITRDGMSTYSFGFMSNKVSGGILISQNDYTAGSLAYGDSDTRSSTATYFNSSNVLSSAAANTARFDYSTGVAQGWLVESTSTNVMQESNGFASVPWIGNNLNYTQNVTGIDGTTSGWTMVPAVASTSGVFEYETLTANSSQNTISIYAKAGTWSYIYLNLEAASGTVWATAVFNVGAANTVATQTSTAGGATISATSQTLMANGYYRITMTSTVASAIYPVWGYAATATGNTFVGGGIVASSTWAATETLLVTDFQYENTSFPTSYIPVPSTSSVTRAADTAANASWYNGTSGNYLMVESKSESTGVISRASYCNSGCTGTSFSAPTNVWIRRICQFAASPSGASAAITNAGNANGTVCTVTLPTPVYVSNGGFGYTAGTSFTPTLPSSINTGDLLIAFTISYGATGNFSSTSGWTTITNGFSSGGGFAAFYQVYSGSGGHSFTNTTGSYTGGVVIRITGASATSPIGAVATASTGTGQPVTTNSITTTQPNSLALWAMWSENSGGWNLAVPSGWSSVFQLYGGSFGIGCSSLSVPASGSATGATSTNLAFVGAWNAVQFEVVQ
jgi:hypothetical protein